MNIELMTELVAGIPDGEYALRIAGVHPLSRMDLYYFTGRGDSYGYAVTQAQGQAVISYELTKSITDTVADALAITNAMTAGLPGYDIAFTKGNQFEAAFPNGFATTIQENK